MQLKETPLGGTPQNTPYLPYLFPASICHTSYPYKGDTMFLAYSNFEQL